MAGILSEMGQPLPELGRRLRSVALRYDSALAMRARPPIAPRAKRTMVRAASPLPTHAASGPTARDAPLARLEAVLLLAREPLASRKLAQLANLPDGTRARSLVRRLRGFYDARGSAFQVQELAGGFQLLTRRKFAPWLRRLGQSPPATRLSGPAMETLAVVAYRQPVLRANVESVRGVQCGEILRQLMERDLVRITGRSTELGRPFLYGTTKRFMQLFGLRHLDELPRSEQFFRNENGPQTSVANQGDEGNDRQSESLNCEEVTAAMTTAAMSHQGPQDTDQDEQSPPPVDQVGKEEEYEYEYGDEEEYEFEDDDEEEGDEGDELEEEEEEDEEDEEEEYEDEELEDDEDEEDEDDEDEEDEEELEGDWEEVEEEDVLEDEDEEEDDDEEEEEWEVDEDWEEEEEEEEE